MNKNDNRSKNAASIAKATTALQTDKLRSDEKTHAEKKSFEQDPNSLLDMIRHAPADLEAMSLEEIRIMFYELQVSQLELEMQNEELHRSKADLDVSRAKLADFYNLAPVGYVTVAEQGLLLDVNLPASAMLGLDRSELVGQMMTRFICKEDQDIYYLLRKKLFETGKPQQCELRMVGKEGAAFWVLLNSIVVHDAHGAPVCRVALSDITERKRSEQFIREREEQFRSLFDNHAAVKLVIDAETGNIVDANKAAVLFYGWSKEELTQMSIRQINTLPSDVIIAEMEKALTSESTRFEFCHRTADGSLREVEVFSSKIEIAGKCFLHSIIHDITDRKKAEKLVRESEASSREQEVVRISQARFREVLEHSMIVSYKRNLQTGSYDYLSPVCERITGYTPEELMAMPFESLLTLIHPDGVPEIEHLLVDSMSDTADPTYQLEYRFKHKDGQYRWLHDRITVIRGADDCPIARIGSVSDITDRKLAENKLLETLRVQKTILDTANVGISLIVDRKQLWVNQKAVDLFQYSKEEIEGQTSRLMYPSQEAYEQFGRDAYPALALGHLYETEQQLIRRDGTQIWVKCNGRAVEPSDLSQGTIWILEDITERKQQEKTLQESQAFNLEILNSISSEIAVLDAAGIILTVNDSWHRFALENSREPGRIPLHTEIGTNYLAFCQANHNSGLAAYEGIQSVLEGRLATFSMEYPCHSPAVNRWFVMNVTPLGTDTFRGAVVAHTDITARKAIEEALMETEAKYRKVFENTMIAICIIDTKTLQLVDINDTFAHLYGYSKDEIIAGISALDLSNEKEMSLENIRTLRINNSFSVPLRYHRKIDGTVFPVEIVGNSYMLNGRPVMLAMVRDISQRIRVKGELLKVYSELEQKVRERTVDLEKTNATLSMMLDHARKTESDIQERVVSNLRSNIMNILDLVKKQQLTTTTQELIEHLEATTLNLAHPFARNLESQLLKLTNREIQLANFIRLGKSTKELMELLNLSANTVGTHRNNLRKKLGLSNKKINLRTYLTTQFVA